MISNHEEYKYDKIKCDRCAQLSEAHYTLSLLTKGLFIHCSKCGTHAAKYQENLNIPWRESKHYKRVKQLELLGSNALRTRETS